MRLDQALAIARRLVIHNDLDYYFFKATNGQWQYVNTKAYHRHRKLASNAVPYTPMELIELALKKR